MSLPKEILPNGCNFTYICIMNQLQILMNTLLVHYMLLLSVPKGLFVGPLIRKYSYRKVALVGSVLSALGLIATYPAESMTHMLTTYSIMGG
jgi:hypothetical protein